MLHNKRYKLIFSTDLNSTRTNIFAVFLAEPQFPPKRVFHIVKPTKIPQFSRGIAVRTGEYMDTVVPQGGTVLKLHICERKNTDRI